MEGRGYRGRGRCIEGLTNGEGALGGLRKLVHLELTNGDCALEGLKRVVHWGLTNGDGALTMKGGALGTYKLGRCID